VDNVPHCVLVRLRKPGDDRHSVVFGGGHGLYRKRFGGLAEPLLPEFRPRVAAGRAPAVHRVDPRRSVAAAAPGRARRTRLPMPDRVVGARSRRCERPGEKGRYDRPEPARPWKPGSKLHVLSYRAGIPLAVGISAANTTTPRRCDHWCGRSRRPAKLRPGRCGRWPAARGWGRGPHSPLPRVGIACLPTVMGDDVLPAIVRVSDVQLLISV
jgi:hypothetical protein